MKILIVSKCPTHPTVVGNSWWILSQTEMFKKMGHNVYFLYISEKPLRQNLNTYFESEEKTIEYWGDHCKLYEVSKREKVRMIFLKYYRMKFCHHHYKVDDNYPYGVEKVVNRWNSEEHFDACIINYYYMSRLFNYISIPKKAIATHDCIAYKNLKINEQTMCITADTEAKAMQRCPNIFALQDVEADYFHLLSPRSNVYNLYGSFCYKPQTIAGNKNIVFLSGNNPFNQNGLKWFLRDVFPLIRHRFSDVQLLVGGSICKVFKDLDTIEGVRTLGYIDDPNAFYAQADVAINPVYQGTGLKIKTFEAISYDKITLVHPHSMEGVYDKPNAPLFASADGSEWVGVLEQVWDNTDNIKRLKAKNAKYIHDMNEYIAGEYNRFINAKD